MKTKLIVFCAIWLLALNVNAQQWHTTLDVLRPAAQQLPDSINDLLIVNNIATQPDDFGHADKQDDQLTGKSNIDLRTAPLLLLAAATQVLDESGLFLSVSLLEHSQNKGNYYQKYSLPQTAVDSLCRLYHTDAVLACDQLVVYDIKESYLTDSYTYLAYLEAYQSTQWTLYCQNGKTQRYQYADTLYWEHEEYSRNGAMQGLPDRRTALLDMSAYVGEQFANRFVPQWEQVDRYFYENDNQYIKQGLEAFVHQRWEQALSLWQQAYAEKDHLTQAYAAANIAGTYEITGGLQAALQWVDKAISAFDRLHSADAQQQKVNLTYYKRQLQQRINDERLLQQ